MKGIKKMKGVKKDNESPSLAAHAAASALRPERLSKTGGLLEWTPEQHFKYWEVFWDKRLESEQLASAPPVILPCTDEDEPLIVD